VIRHSLCVVGTPPPHRRKGKENGRQDPTAAAPRETKHCRSRASGDGGLHGRADRLRRAGRVAAANVRLGSRGKSDGEERCEHGDDQHGSESRRGGCSSRSRLKYHGEGRGEDGHCGSTGGSREVRKKEPMSGSDNG